MATTVITTLDPDPADEPTARERAATLLERRLDVPMAVLAAVWAGLVAYELIAPRAVLPALTVAGNVIWGLFAVELAAKLAVSGHPGRFVVRHWPSLLFLLLPALRMLGSRVRCGRCACCLRPGCSARRTGPSGRRVGCWRVGCSSSSR